MIMLLLVVTVLLTIMAVGMWAALKDLPARDPDDSSPGERRPASSPTASSLEGALVASLLRHEITPGQYQRAIERLAERDDDIHPFTVPPEGSVGHE
ncbi:hypothetical protein [Actinoplanes solisilvae]|uniref:hypothetical protein n=1 Tax=Actinoplanes solisilvae TaxID=2486853 RepID=UPI000FDAD822|nr:hypothetical protein [Actinoplanes solisilvae]